MTNSIPQFVQVDEPVVAPTTDDDEMVLKQPVEDSPEDLAQRKVLAELEKIPQADRPMGGAYGSLTPRQLDEAKAAEAELQQQQAVAADPAAMLMETLPRMLEMIGLVQEAKAIITGVQVLAERNHKEIHALKARVDFLESMLAGRPKADPPLDLPAPSLLSPADAASGGIEVTDAAPKDQQ